MFPPGDTKANAAAKAPPLAGGCSSWRSSKGQRERGRRRRARRAEGDDFKDAIATLVNLDQRIAAYKPPRKLITRRQGGTHHAEHTVRRPLAHSSGRRPSRTPASPSAELESLRQEDEEMGENVPD